MRVETNITVTAILARCLVEPQFQERLLRDPNGVLREYRLSRDVRSSFARFEFEKLRLFGGLITQTQHNFLWETFPYTRALMKHYAVELSIFSSYRQRHREGRADTSRHKKIEEFTDYLKQFLLEAEDRRAYPGFLDVLKHELILWELQEMVARRSTRTRALAPPTPPRVRELDRSIPVFPRHVRLGEYRYDPLEIGSALERKEFDPSRLKPRITRFFYRMDPATKQLSMFQTTSMAWRLFQKVDGQRSVGSILRASTSTRHKHELRRYFESAYTGELIKLRSPS